MEFGEPETACATPAEPFAPSPTPPVKSEPAPEVHAPFDAVSRYCWKLSVVPDESERTIGVMFASGSSAPSLRAAMAGSFHVVIEPLKIFAAVSAFSTSSSTPSTL